jgi:hypothetical protein
MASLKSAYGKAPFFEDHFFFLERIFSEKVERLIDLNVKIIRHLLEHLRIHTEVRLLSKLDIKAKEPKLSVEICKKLGASHFLAQKSAKKYLDMNLFQEGDIELKFITPRPPVYPQLWGPFLPNLSAFDLLFNCGPKGHEILKTV